MATLNGYSEEIKACYNNVLLPIQRRYDKVRRRIMINYLIIGFVIFAAFIFEALTWMLIGIIVVITFVFLYIKWFWIDREKFERQYHRAMYHAGAETLLKQSQWHFDDQAYLDLNTLNKSALLSHKPQELDGYLRLDIKDENSDTVLSDLTAESTFRDKMGQSNSVMLFSGLVWKSNPKKEVLLAEGGINILGDYEFDAFPDQIWKARNWVDLSAEIDKENLQYQGNKHAEIDNIFSSSLLTHIEAYRTRTGKTIRLSLIDSTLYGMISNEGPRFPVNIFKSLVDSKSAIEWLEDLQLAHFICKKTTGNPRTFSTT
ncbi:MAG: hypothetical protein ACI959_000280 [Limisphaerales bacterium]|jgi:hypothetical protein